MQQLRYLSSAARQNEYQNKYQLTHTSERLLRVDLFGRSNTSLKSNLMSLSILGIAVITLNWASKLEVCQAARSTKPCNLPSRQPATEWNADCVLRFAHHLRLPMPAGNEGSAKKQEESQTLVTPVGTDNTSVIYCQYMYLFAIIDKMN